MISVSDSFKNAIKNQNREIRGYVDIKYQDNTFNTSVIQTPTRAELVSSDALIKGYKTVPKYATLENNYTLLDGSFTVWNENKVLNNSGYISQKVFQSISDTAFIIDNSSNTPTKGITIYFKDNLPFDFTVAFYDNNNNYIEDRVTNNQSMTYQYVFTEETIITEIAIEIYSMEFPDNRIRIAYVDFNLSDLYEGEELIRFNVMEELDLLVENIPINTCSVNVNNYPSANGGNKFDVINPRGITKYLNDNVTIEPYIGVVTESDGVEYVPMGVFYLSDWSSDTDGNVTLNGKSVLNKLSEELVKSNGSFLRAVFNSTSFSTFLNQTTGHEFSFINYSSAWNHNQFMNNFNIMEYLKSAVICMLFFDNFDTEYEQYRKFYVDRYNIIKLNPIDFEPIESIDRSCLKKDVDYTTRERVKTLNVKMLTTPQLSRPSGASKEVCIDITYTLKSSEDYLWLTSEKYMEWASGEIQYTVISGSASATLIDYNTSSIYVKVLGTAGSQIRIKYLDYVYTGTNIGTKTETMINDKVERGSSVTVDITAFIDDITAYYNAQMVPYKFNKIYFNLDKPYQIKASTIGDPSLTLGDTVSIQTRYTETNDGYKNMTITKQTFTFDGGLSCEIEGVGD